ncbi:MAG: hypothetical protein KFKLKKLM_01903 [Flavobacteriales bacterium]|nr:hypothetical protein [Flavobacteriales bacterium]
MNVFLPFKRETNVVLDEIELYFNGNFIYDSYTNFYKHKVDIINIHWPESIFGFSIPSIEQLCDLEESLIEWKKTKKIVYTIHNNEPHIHINKNNKILYELIIKYADALIHLGKFSLTEFKKNYPNSINKKMTIISHPAYTLFENNITKNEARNILKIPLHKKVILVFGSVRTNEEASLIFNAFNKVKTNDKFLLISNFNVYKPLPKNLIQRVKKYINTKLERLKHILRRNTLINYDFVLNNKVQVYLNAADVIFIARKKILNSGNVFLGYSFKKIVVGPDVGNVGEYLKAANNPVFNPQKIQSIANALEEGLNYNKDKGDSNFQFVNDNYHPSKIASLYNEFFTELIYNH